MFCSVLIILIKNICIDLCSFGIKEIEIRFNYEKSLVYLLYYEGKFHSSKFNLI